MTSYFIELWDMETEHVFLATDDAGKVLEFPRDQKDAATLKAHAVIDELHKTDPDSEWMYFVTDFPSRFAKPLV